VTNTFLILIDETRLLWSSFLKLLFLKGKLKLQILNILIDEIRLIWKRLLKLLFLNGKLKLEISLFSLYINYFVELIYSFNFFLLILH